MKKIILGVSLLIFAVSYNYANVALVMPHVYGQHGTQVTMPVKVANFHMIISAQGTVQFDPLILTYVSVQNFSLGMNISNFGTTSVNTGILTFSWYDGTLVGYNLADSAILFSITFNIIGSNGQTSPLAFASTPTINEIVDTSFNTLSLTLMNGSITVDPTASIGSPDQEKNGPVLLQNYPNPFSGTTTIDFTLPYEDKTMISIFDLNGKEIDEVSGRFSAGRHSFVWNTKDIYWGKLQPGIYYLRLQTGNKTYVRKMTLTD